MFEPALEDDTFFGSRVLDAFKAEADVVLTNRMAPYLDDIVEKVCTRDLFGSD